jgi:pimeloyl-ACP methyl ester carboxylesterase
MRGNPSNATGGTLLQSIATPSALASTLKACVTSTPLGFTIQPLSSPKATLDAALLARPGNVDIQLDLLFDYANNVKLYPRFQEYFRTSKPPLLAIWGEFDPYFIPAGAKAFQRDIPNATVKFLPTGHFALGTHLKEIALAMRDFLK